MLELEVLTSDPSRSVEAGELVRELDDLNREAESLIQQVRNGERAIMKLWVLLAGG
jgi:hypothetical protein